MALNFRSMSRSDRRRWNILAAAERHLSDCISMTTPPAIRGTKNPTASELGYRALIAPHATILERMGAWWKSGQRPAEVDHAYLVEIQDLARPGYIQASEPPADDE